MVINLNQNVGIGTTSPTGFRLVVENTSEDMLKLHNSTDGLDSLISFTNSGGTLARIQGLDNGGLQFDTGKSAGGLNTNVMHMDNGGNVGIGTDSPGQKLEVAGRIRVTSDPTIEFYEASNKRGGVQWNATNDYVNMFAVGGDIRFDIGGEKMRIRSGGGIINQYRAAINVGQTAVGITSASTYGGMAMVWMNYVGNISYDLVTWSLSQVTVLASQSISGGASGRIYTSVSGILKLQMGGSDTYQVYVSDITNSPS